MRQTYLNREFTVTHDHASMHFEVEQAFLGEVERRNEGTVEDELAIQGGVSLRENSIIKRGVLVTGPA